MAVFVRLAGDIHFIEKAFFRNFVAFFIASTWIYKDFKRIGKKAVEIPQGALKFLICRAIAGTVGIFANFYAIDHLNISDDLCISCSRNCRCSCAPVTSIIACAVRSPNGTRTL